MSRYIDADKIEYYSNINYHGTDYKMTSEIYINNMPTADVKPIVYGEWELFGTQGGIPISYICSNCNWHWTNNKFNFCPNCGATIRKE